MALKLAKSGSKKVALNENRPHVGPVTQDSVNVKVEPVKSAVMRSVLLLKPNSVIPFAIVTVVL